MRRCRGAVCGIGNFHLVLGFENIRGIVDVFLLTFYNIYKNNPGGQL
jgi:hypothetical protein